MVDKQVKEAVFNYLNSLLDSGYNDWDDCVRAIKKQFLLTDETAKKLVKTWRETDN